MLAVGRVIPGAFAEVTVPNEAVYTTSEVKSVEVVANEWPQETLAA